MFCGAWLHLDLTLLLSCDDVQLSETSILRRWMTIYIHGTAIVEQVRAGCNNKKGLYMIKISEMRGNNRRATRGWNEQTKANMPCVFAECVAPSKLQYMLSLTSIHIL